MASAIVLIRWTSATGPNGSSFIRRAESGTSASRVGAQKLPGPLMRSPPASRVAPCASASPIRLSIACGRRGLASGPIWVAASRPGPTVRPLARCAMAAAKRSAMASCTIRRVGETQTWPALRHLKAETMVTVFSMSQSSHTITGPWPPSSMVVRLAPSAASRIRCLPTGTEPVKLILRMMGLAMRWRETVSGTPNTIEATLAGRPASRKHCSTRTAVPGASSGGLMIIEQPAASAGASLRAGLRIGKFHGHSASDGPTGSWMTRLRCPVGRVSTRP